jgi:predicted nucleic acid-binding protein
VTLLEAANVLVQAEQRQRVTSSASQLDSGFFPDLPFKTDQGAALARMIARARAERLTTYDWDWTVLP